MPRLVLCLLLLPTLALAMHQGRRAPRAGMCTHWASPTAEGTACTRAAPCSAQQWLHTLAAPGRTLCLLPGYYWRDVDMLNVPGTLAGNLDHPITIKAEQDGTVLLDGGDWQRPIHMRGSYGIIEGLNVTRGDNTNIRFDNASSNWVLRRVVTWDAGADGDAGITVAGTNNLVEDVGIFGSARKPLEAGAAGGDGNVIRRVWARWEQNLHAESNPCNALEMGYGQDGVTMENTIATWDKQGESPLMAPEGVAQLFTTQYSQWLGSIFYVPASASFQPSVVVGAFVDGGSHAQQGQFHPAKEVLFKHNLAFISPQHPNFAGIKAYYFAECYDPGCLPGENNHITANVGVSGQPSFFSASWPAAHNQQGTSLSAAIGQGKSVWTDSVAAPGLCKRYQYRQLTTEPLWPWDMNQRIIDAMVAAGREPVDVTATMEAMFGPIPPQCRAGGVPPQPEPPTPGGPLVLGCTGTVSAVPGTVTMTCTQHVEGRR